MAAVLLKLLDTPTAEKLHQPKLMRRFQGRSDFVVSQIYLYMLAIVYVHDREISEEARDFNCKALRLVFGVTEELCKFFHHRSFQFAWDSDFYQEDALEEISNIIKDPKRKTSLSNEEFMRLHQHMLGSRSENLSDILYNSMEDIDFNLCAQLEKTLQTLLALKEKILVFRQYTI